MIDVNCNNGRWEIDSNKSTYQKEIQKSKDIVYPTEIPEAIIIRGKDKEVAKWDPKTEFNKKNLQEMGFEYRGEKEEVPLEKCDWMSGSPENKRAVTAPIVYQHEEDIPSKPTGSWGENGW
jgi:hypothetical protein